MTARILMVALAAAARPTAAEANFGYDRFVPTVALKTEAGKSIDATVTGNFVLNEVDRRKDSVTLSNWTLGPTLKLSGTSGTNGFLSFGTGTDGTDPSLQTGAAKVSAGALFAFTRLAPLPALDGKREGKIQDAKREAFRTCVQICPPSGGAQTSAGESRAELKPDEETFCKGPGRRRSYDLDICEFCSAGRDIVARAEGRQQQLAFPTTDISVWVGGGAAHFDYYEQQSAAASGGTATFATASAWHPALNAAFLATWLPADVSRAAVLTVETPFTLQRGYQDSKTSGTACMIKGTVAGDGSTLSACSPAQPIGAPKAATTFSVDVAAGVADRAGGAWRAALDVGFSRTLDNAANVWTVKLPIYVNAGAFTTVGANTADPTPGKTVPFALDYNGIIRLTPTFQTFPAKAGGRGWSAFLALDLLTQTSLFVRADTLVN